MGCTASSFQTVISSFSMDLGIHIVRAVAVLFCFNFELLRHCVVQKSRQDTFFNLMPYLECMDERLKQSADNDHSNSTLEIFTQHAQVVHLSKFGLLNNNSL